MANGRPSVEDFLRRADPNSDPAWRAFQAQPDVVPAEVVSAIMKEAAEVANAVNDQFEK